MKLQIALDRLSREKCIEVIDTVKEHIDIIEIGTGVINEYGLSLVRDIKQLYPDKKILADLKICDAGESESRNAFEYGADIITVMSFADPSTIEACVKNAEKYERETVVDLLNNQSEETLHHLAGINVKSVSLHIGKDQQKDGAVFSPLSRHIHNFNFNVYVAGGINNENIDDYLKLKPEVVIVGSGITKSADPASAGEQLKRKISLY